MKFMIATGIVVNQQTGQPLDLLKEVTADGYLIDPVTKVLHFYKDLPPGAVPGDPNVHLYYCAFHMWNFVYSEGAIPAPIETAAMMPTPRRASAD